MGPELWVGLAAVFVSGGAIGAAGTLLSQWLIRKMGNDQAPPRVGNDREVALLRAEVADLGRQVRNLDDRLDFQEKLLGGATPTTHPPPRLEPAEPEPEGE